MGIDDDKSPWSMTWEERRYWMNKGAFIGSDEEERKEREAIKAHFKKAKSGCSTTPKRQT